MLHLVTCGFTRPFFAEYLKMDLTSNNMRNCSVSLTGVSCQESQRRIDRMLKAIGGGQVIVLTACCGFSFKGSGQVY